MREHDEPSSVPFQSVLPAAIVLYAVHISPKRMRGELYDNGNDDDDVWNTCLIIQRTNKFGRTTICIHIYVVLFSKFPLMFG